MFHWDGMLFQYFSERDGLGAIISNETGIAACWLTGSMGSGERMGHRLNGHVRGESEERRCRSVSFRWIPEFHLRNLLKNNTPVVGLTLKL